MWGWGGEGRKSPGLCAESLQFPRREASLQAESQESPSLLQLTGPRSCPPSPLLMGSMGLRRKGTAVPPEGSHRIREEARVFVLFPVHHFDLFSWSRERAAA